MDSEQNIGAIRSWLQKHPLSIGAAGFVATYFFLGFVADLLGLPKEFHDDGPGRLHWLFPEGFGISHGDTNVGLYQLVASGFVGWRLFNLGDVSTDQKIQWWYWFIGLTAWIVFTELIYLLDLPEYLKLFLSVLVVAGMVYYLPNRVSIILKVRNLKVEDNDSEDGEVSERFGDKNSEPQERIEQFSSKAELFDLIWAEIENGTVEKKLWNRIVVEQLGDERKTKAVYLSERAEQLKKSSSKIL